MSRGQYIPQLDNIYHRTPVNAKPVYYEYVSRYRRITVLGESGGFAVKVQYKDIEVKDWSTRWGEKNAAIAWAKCYAKNREIRQGMLTIIEPMGVQNI